MNTTGLSETDIAKIKEVFLTCPEIEKAVLYGSRAKGTFKPASDIDLTLIGENLNLTILHLIENQLDDLLLPYKIDLSLMNKIENQALLEHIARVGKLFYKKKNLQISKE